MGDSAKWFLELGTKVFEGMGAQTNSVFHEFFEANELDLAREQAARALALCRQAQIADGVWWALYILARVHLAGGEIDPLRQICRETRQLDARANQGLYGPWFVALEAQAGLQAAGDLGEAERWARSAGLSPDDVPHRWNEYPYVVYVRLLLAQDRLQDAQKLLATMEGVARTSQRLRSLITVYLQQALVYQALGRERQALARVVEALRLAAPEGYHRAFLDEGPTILELLPRVRPIAPAFVEGLLAASPTDRLSASADEAQPSPLIGPLQDVARTLAGASPDLCIQAGTDGWLCWSPAPSPSGPVAPLACTS